MARRCSVCVHPERERIDRELARGAIGPVALGRRYGLNRRSLSYHRERHLLYMLDPKRRHEFPDLSGIRAIVVMTRKGARAG